MGPWNPTFRKVRERWANRHSLHVVFAAAAFLHFLCTTCGQSRACALVIFSAARCFQQMRHCRALKLDSRQLFFHPDPFASRLHSREGRMGKRGGGPIVGHADPGQVGAGDQTDPRTRVIERGNQSRNLKLEHGLLDGAHRRETNLRAGVLGRDAGHGAGRPVLVSGERLKRLETLRSDFHRLLRVQGRD